MVTRIRKSRIYRIVLWTALFGCLFLLWRLGTNVLTRSPFVMDEDYWRFWSAWRILLNGQNPYDANNISPVMHLIPGFQGVSDQYPLIRNPPWTLVFMFPALFLNYLASRIMWMVLSIILLLIGANTLWRVFGGPIKMQWMSWLMAIIFIPSFFMLKQGQMNALIFLGIAGFLYFVNKQPNDWLAGLSIALMTVKPHTIFLFWPVLLIWIFVKRRWIILLSSCLFIGGTTLLTMIFDPKIVSEFFNITIGDPSYVWHTPTLGFFFWNILGRNNLWVQFLFALIALVWTLFRTVFHLKIWNWLKEMNFILWLSALSTPYALLYDYVLLLVPVISTTAILLQEGFNKTTIGWLSIFGLINLSIFILHRNYPEVYFFWLAPVFFLWYFFANKSAEMMAHKDNMSGRNNNIQTLVKID